MPSTTFTHMPGICNNHPRMPSLIRKLDNRLRASDIEAYPFHWAGRAFYVPDRLPTEHEPYIPAEFVAFHPGPSPDVQHNKDLCFLDSAYEIRVCGMAVSRFDPIIPFRRNQNEIIMYSTQKESGRGGGLGNGLDGVVSKNDGIPYIHYDHKKDQSVTPDRYYPVAASKSLVVRSGTTEHRESVNVRFNIIEIDEKSDDLDRTLNNLDQLGGSLSTLTAAVPYLALLTPALSTIGAVGNRALDSYAIPDKVLNTDVDFMIAKRDSTYLKNARPGRYLRYGYYVFLAEPVKCKLYLATNTLGNMRVMVRRIPRKSRRGGKHRQLHPKSEYVPLKHCDYIVVRVTPPEGDAEDKRASIRVDHMQRLQKILSGASATDPSDLKKSITSVLRDTGLQAAEAVHETWNVPRAEPQRSKQSDGNSTDGEH
eukprot:Plantae.Rhodophyta-Hildenbrandia_rubra.ctg8194.p1 GENE.Plantae.Rhodophyta-Hildenbrandia_rubra.ctg8194~~Plantae.Rhodophyta-Hildenbrandia_rubra.ctg8194.p1  ORF type:complete len:424 (+),score=70.50 Plantae.Rhodophyta-Hildenbrandia_rubra.ctg8194:127-1398(+)